MNHVMKGSKRDAEILESIELCGAMDTQQIAALHFRFKSGLRKCQERLQSLHERKLIKRARLSMDSPYVYFYTRPALPRHTLAISWIYVWLAKQKRIQSWELEQLEEFGILRCDALCSIRNEMTQETLWCCVEFESSANKSKFDKVEKYTKLYEKHGIKGSPLMQRLDGADRFPRVILVADNAKRGLKMREVVQAAHSPVKFEIHLLSEIVKEASTCTQ
ncbi:hypothetical protein [Desulfitobacterium chlororespirans]|uniref:Replication-relaxation n=1 Tax=Desulfitobacterium chlororespirans DSM 11544 TaxID=1121395 RepID=A0A1M7UP17_9FIRM|nr:hypothetical protein [Desulfitobacterium chlororespirans]SHN84752.1 hypothetical protein SAMN02745215_04271 [Desulfitobacterium chlororespirans DSM 11544]